MIKMGKLFRLQQLQRRELTRKLNIATVYLMCCTSIIKLMTCYVLWQKSNSTESILNGTNSSSF